MAVGSTQSDLPVITPVYPELPTGDDYCNRKPGMAGGQHTWVWITEPRNTVRCVACGQERERTRNKAEVVTVPSFPLDQPVPALTDADIFADPKVPAEDITEEALEQRDEEQQAAYGALIQSVETPAPPPASDPTFVTSIPAFTGGGQGTSAEVGMPSSPPAAPVEAVEVAAPAPSPRE